MSYYIAHSGTKGMKWGVRKYQNEDGTLTTEGKLRYARLNSKKDAKRLHYNTAAADQASRYRDQDRSLKESVASDKKYLDAKSRHDAALANKDRAQATARHDRALEAKQDAYDRAHHAVLGAGSMPTSAISEKQKAEAEELIKKNIPASAWNQRVNADKSSPTIKNTSYTNNPYSGMPTSTMEAKAAAEAEARRERMRKEKERAERERKMKANMPTSAWNAYKNR